MATTAADPLARKPFGQTGLSVPPVAVGCAPIGNMPEAFAYGVAATLHTVAAVARYVHEQGMADRVLDVEEIFVPELLDT